MPRIAIGGLAKEVNTFAGGSGTVDDFQQQTFLTGDEILGVASQNDSLAGAIQIADERRIDLVPTFYGSATSGPTLTKGAYRQLRSLLLDPLRRQAGQVDGVYLRMHGAMTAEGCDDVEGDLLDEVRKIMGPDTPIAASLDFHAHCTATMTAATPLIAGYQTYPHVDKIDTGRRAMTLLADKIAGRIHPTVGFRKIPVIAASEAEYTTTGPVAEVMTMLHEVAELPDVLDATIFATQPWLDVTDYGWSVVVITDDDQPGAQAYADSLAAALFDRRNRLTVAKTPLAEALTRARTAQPDECPVVVGDGADSPSAGSTGDSADLLRAVIAEPVGDTVLSSIVDPPAAAACFDVGVGETITTNVGGLRSPQFFSPVPITGTVVTLCDGRSHNPRSPMNTGRTAVVQIREIFLVITELATAMLDHRLYDRVGLDVRSARLVQAKSAGGYRQPYADIAGQMIDLDMRGPAQHDLLSLPFTKIPRPIWPFDANVTRGW